MIAIYKSSLYLYMYVSSTASQVWTEKEFKNLNRLHRDGVPCPKPHFFREHLLCMVGRLGLVWVMMELFLNENFSCSAFLCQ